MSSAGELRTWLNRPTHDFAANLAFATKAWRSIEFVLITKHEIITEEFCAQLPALRKQLRKSDDAEAATERAWSQCCEFLALPYAAGAISAAVKAQLVQTLRTEAHKSLKHAHPRILEALLTTLHHTAMQNFYKSSPAALADLIATVCRYQRQLLARPQLAVQSAPALAKLFAGLLQFVRQTPLLEEFRQRFAAVAFVPLVELVVALRGEHAQNYMAEFFAIVQEMFFPGGSAQALRDWLKRDGKPEQDDSEFRTMFALPTHAFALWLEAILIAFRVDAETQIALHRFLFGGAFGVDADDGGGGDAADQLRRVTWYLCVLRRHEAQLMAKMDGGHVRWFLRPHIEALCERHHGAHLEATLQLMCAAIRLEPMILEHSMVPLAVKCMVLPKDEAAATRYAEYVELVLEVFRKLSHAAKFVSHLLRSLMECLAKTKLSSKTLKRRSAAATTTAAKRAKADEGAEADADETEASAADRFFAMLQRDFEVPASAASTGARSSATDFADIAFAWPPAVGQAFIQFIGSLVSRPAVIVWKNILFALTDYVTLLKEGHRDANTLFLVDCCAALFCQYFAGARLAEQTDRMWRELVEPVRTLTHSLLHEFGKAVVGGAAEAHSDRSVQAFLKCCVAYGDWELLCFYYWPDTMEPVENARQVHPYLSGGEADATVALWPLIERRIAEHGSADCKRQAQRVRLQQVYGEALLSESPAASQSDRVRIATPEDVQLIAQLLGAPAAGSLIAQLSGVELRELCAVLAGDGAETATPFSAAVLRNAQFVYAVALALFNRAAGQFNSGSVKPLDCAALLEADAGEVSKLVARVEKSAAAAKPIATADIAGIQATLARLGALPTDFLEVPRRNILFVLLLDLLVAARRTSDAALVQSVLAQLRRFVHFGAVPELFAVLPVDRWLRILGPASPDVLPLYRSAFERIVVGKAATASTTAAFEQLLAMLQQADVERAAEGLLDIGMVLAACLATDHRHKAIFNAFARVLLAAVVKHLERIETSATTDNGELTEFVARTVAGFVVVLGPALVGGKDKDASAVALDAGVRRACAVYMQHIAVADQFAAFCKLLNIVMTHRAVLEISEEQLAGHVKRYWAEYLLALRDRPDAVADHSEAFVRAVLNSKTAEEFVDLLDEEQEDGSVDVVEQFCGFKYRLFGHVARSQLTKVKGSIFNELFKQLALRIVMQLRLRAAGPLHQHADVVEKLLAVQRRLCTNILLPVSVELVDDVLAFLGEIGIRQLAEAGSKVGVLSAEAAAEHSARFVRLHSAMTDVTLALVQHRYFHVVDRVAQFGGIVKDLLHAVAFFRASVVGKVGGTTVAQTTAATAAVAATTAPTIAPLDKADVGRLAELSHRLENIVKSFVKHEKDVKRIAPYLLLSTIQLLVSDAHPTTNEPKIKTHFDAVCFDLIAVCDHRVEGFVMRNCNEASKQVYEQLKRDFNKYHKFKGKV